MKKIIAIIFLCIISSPIEAMKRQRLETETLNAPSSNKKIARYLNIAHYYNGLALEESEKNVLFKTYTAQIATALDLNADAQQTVSEINNLELLLQDKRKELKNKLLSTQNSTANAFLDFALKDYNPSPN